MDLPGSFTMAVAPDPGQAIWVNTEIATRLKVLAAKIKKTNKITYNEVIVHLLEAYDANH